jgi:transcriptional regulator with XRE-family HTH domain
MTLTEKLDSLMKEKGINRRQLSQQSEIPYMTIVNFYEKGTENVKLSTLKKLANYFHVSLDYIADDSIESVSSASVSSTAEFPDEEKRLLFHFHSLNFEGRQKLLSYSDDLISSGKYAVESAEA